MPLQFPPECYKLFKRFAHTQIFAVVENKLVDPYHSAVLVILVKSTIM